MRLQGGNVQEGNYRDGRSMFFDSQVVYNHQRWLDYSSRFSGSGGSLEYGVVNSLTAPLFDEGVARNNKILLIVSESWGVPQAPIQKVILAPLLQRKQQLTA